MATDLHQPKAAPPANRHEAFVEAQLARARARVRSLDLAGAVLGLLIFTLAYGLIVALCDRWLELPALVRQTAFAVYAVGALIYLGLFVIRPSCRQINPYYAARRLEQTIPEAKNSVVNWLDLRQRAMAPALRSAIGQQAAKNLADADLEQAISGRRAGRLGGSAAVLFIILLILFVLGPGQFISLMNRAFAPFVEAAIATRTRLQLTQPEGGDVTIQVGRAVAFAVWVEGRIPEASSPQALRLLYRYNLGDPYQTRLLERGESSRAWHANLLAAEVHNGFWYQIAGGDAETAEYRVQVRSTPLFIGFDVLYHYRPYLRWPDRITHDQNLQDLRGTEVTLLARTNRTVKDGLLAIDGQKPIPGEVVDGDALRFHLRLDNDGTYRIWFRSVDGERNLDPMPYTIRVLQDQPPQVELLKPGADSQLPGNGVLRLEGTASDDFGIANLRLRMKIENGPSLQPKPYRKGETLRRGDGSYPQMLAYQDFAELDKLQNEDGQALESLKAGAAIEYWLEATDNCDYPGPNIGESKHFKVTIQAADADNKKQEQDRQQARQEQQNHEKKQDQELQNQRRDSRDKQEQNSESPAKEQPGKQGDGQNEEDLNRQKEQIQNAINEQERKQQAGDKNDSNGSNSQPSKADGKSQSSSENQKGQAQDNRQSGQEKKGQSPTSPGNAEHKDKGQSGPRADGEQQNKTGQQSRPKEDERPPAKENTSSKSTGDEKRSQENGEPSPAGENANGKKDQRGTQSKAAQPNSEQRSADDKRADKKPQGSPEPGNTAGTDKKPEAGAEKTDKTASGQESSNQQSGQPKGEPQQGGSSGRSQPENGQTKNAEPSTGKTGESSGEFKSAKPATPDKGDSKDARSNAAKAEEKPGGADKGDAGSPGTEKKEADPNRAAQGKPATEKADKGAAGSESGRQDQPGKSERPDPSQAEKKSQDDVSKLSEALKNGDENTRANARKKLQDLRDKAPDQGVRRAAAEALERARQDSAEKQPETKPGMSKDPSAPPTASNRDQDGPNSQKSSDPDKKNSEKAAGKADAAKGRPKNGERPNAPSDSGSKTDEQSRQPASSGKPAGSGASGRTGGNEPTAQTPNPGGSSDSRPDREPEPMDAATAANAAYQKKASELQLEEIKKKINKDVLKQLNMSEEDFQRFVNAYEEMLSRKQPPGAAKENLAGPQRGNRSLPSQDVRLIDPREQAKSGTLQRIGPAVAPLEFRDAYKEFSKRISEMEQSKEKK